MPEPKKKPVPRAAQDRKPPPPVLIKMPERIAEALKDKGWNRSRLATELDMNRGHLSGMTSGKRVGGISAAWVIRIAEKLNVNPGWLLAANGPKRGPSSIILFEGTPEYDRAIDAIKRNGES
jgi:transcriptional regulator with XRE-family HTH domain